jgi:hypothetical protein
MKTIAFVVFLLSATALADYAPPAVKCTVPPDCVTCGAGSDAGPNCLAEALDAGLILSGCFDFTGYSTSWQTQVTHYYCPPGVTAYRGHVCGCASVEVVAVMLLAMVPLLRRRRKR